MVILDVFKENICVTYKTTLFSKAAFLTFLFGIVSVVLPFIFAYKSKGFWVKRERFYEQPDIRFKGEYVFIATTDNFTNPIITCSLLNSHQISTVLDTCSFIKVREFDKNYDGRVDELSINLQINLPEETHLTAFHLIVPLDYKLYVCPLHMQAAIIFQQFLLSSISQYMTVSDLKVFQTSPLNCHKKFINQVCNYPVINKDIYNILQLNSIINEYAERNISTFLQNIYSNFIQGRAKTFVLDLKIKYPEDMFYYKPDFWQIMKWAWIQYLSIFLIVSWFVDKIKTYIFNRRLVLLYEDNPFKKKQ